MKLTYDKETGAAYLYLRKIKRGEVGQMEIALLDSYGILLDLSKDGELMGIEFLKTSILPKSFLKKAVKK